MPSQVVIDGNSLTLEDVAAVATTASRVSLSPAARDRAAEISRLRDVRVTGNGRLASIRAGRGLSRMRAAQSADPSASAGVQLRRRSATEVEITWSDADWSGALIRDPVTGSLLAVGRGGRALVMTRHDELELVLSDAVQSVQIRGRVASP